MWLIKTDQKVFIPGAIAQHISGSTLLQLTQEELRELWSKTKVDFPVGDIALRSLFNSVESLRDEGKVCRELYGTEKVQDSCGRLIQSLSGWTYDREREEWSHYLVVFQHKTLATVVKSDIERQQWAMQIVVLMFSAITTALTSASFIGAESQISESEKNGPVKIATLIVTFLMTIVSGYIQIVSSSWKDQLTKIDKYLNGTSKLVEYFEENLTVSVNDRLPFAEYKQAIKKCESSMPERLEFTPSQRNRAYAEIKAQDLSAWKRAFMFFEIRERNPRKFGWARVCPWCCGSPVCLGEPVDEVYTYALMRFSSEQMGAHTSTPDVFKEDKAKAKKGYELLAQASGESVTTGITP